METRNYEPQEQPGQIPSRRAFLQEAAGVGLAAATALTLLPSVSEAQSTAQKPTTPPAASGPSASDLAILNYALTLERLESTFYNLNGDKAYLGTGTLKEIVAEIQADENAHVALLLGALGANAAPAPQFQGLDAPTLTQFLTMTQTFEDIGVSAYLGQVPAIQDPNILATAGGIMDVEARHAGGIRAYRKDLPSQGNPTDGADPADTLTEDSEAVDRARTMAEVLALVAPFIVGSAATTPPATTPSTTTPATTTPTTSPATTGMGGTTSTSTGGTTSTGTGGATGTGTAGTPSTGTGGTTGY